MNRSSTTYTLPSQSVGLFLALMFHCRRENLPHNRTQIINTTIMRTDAQPLIMALEDSCSGTKQSHQTPSSGRKSEIKNSRDAVVSTCLCICLTCLCMRIHTDNFALNSSFAKSQRCQRCFVYPIWLWKRSQQNKGGILEGALCQTFSS